MSRLRDIGHVMRHPGPWGFTKRVVGKVSEDNLLVWAAALAYSWLFAVFPFLIFCLSLIPLLPDALKPEQEQLEQFINAALVTGEDPGDPIDLIDPTSDPIPEEGEPEEGAAPGAGPGDAPDGPAEQDAAQPGPEPPPGQAAGPEPQGEQPAESPNDEPVAPISQTIAELISEFLNRPSGGVLTISLLIALFTASGGMAMTMAGLDECYDVRKPRPLYKSRPIAMLLTVIVAVLIVLALVVMPISSAVLNYLAEREVGPFGMGPVLLLLAPVRYALGLLLLLSVLALIYRWGPSVRTRMHLFSPGSVFCILMWILTAVGFRIYLESFGAAENYARTYGAVAGVAVLMLLFYVNALCLLVGAEINAQIDFIRLGIHSDDESEEEKAPAADEESLDEEDVELREELREVRAGAETEVAGDGEGI